MARRNAGEHSPSLVASRPRTGPQPRAPRSSGGPCPAARRHLWLLRAVSLVTFIGLVRLSNHP